MGFRQETLRRHPGYRQTQESGLPSLPNRPRAPHVPHARTLVMGVALTLAGTAAAASLEKASQTLAQTHVDPRINVVPAEQMRYPWDSGNVYLELNFRESGSNSQEFLGVEITNDPTTFQVSEDRMIVYVLGEEYGEPENLFGHVRITLLNDVMEGGVWEKSVDAQGNTILNPEGKPILNQFGHVEPIPGEAGQHVSA